MSYARDPYDTDQPPCVCGTQSPGPVLATAEFCPACGDPDKPAGTSILLRDREVLEHISVPGSAGERCAWCKAPVVEGWFHWLDENGEPSRNDPMYGGAIQSFPAWRHADGTPGHGDPKVHGQGGLVMHDSNRCPDCKGFDTIEYEDTGYGDNCRCTACGWHKYFDRGD